MTWTINLPWSKPPLTANMRFKSWHPEARLVREIRDTTFILARAARLPKGLSRIEVQMHYRPRDNRRRDADNLVPTLKAACDALAAGTVKYPGYGMVRDDTPDQMVKHMPIIHPAEKGEGGSMWLEIRPI